jgi:hypothetical protein
MSEMNASNMPGFTAEESLNRATEFYRTLSIGRQIRLARVLPQAKGGFTIAGQDPNNICIYRTCIITINDNNTLTGKCSSQNICAHP